MIIPAIKNNQKISQTKVNHTYCAVNTSRCSCEMCLYNQRYLFVLRVLHVFIQCSASCGVGVQNREVYCRLKGSGRVRDDACDVRQRPAVTRPCQRAECTHYTWVAGDWEAVSTGKAVYSSSLRVSQHVTDEQMFGHVVTVFIGRALRSFFCSLHH